MLARQPIHGHLTWIFGRPPCGFLYFEVPYKASERPTTPVHRKKKPDRKAAQKNERLGARHRTTGSSNNDDSIIAGGDSSNSEVTADNHRTSMTTTFRSIHSRSWPESEIIELHNDRLPPGPETSDLSALGDLILENRNGEAQSEVEVTLELGVEKNLRFVKSSTEIESVNLGGGDCSWGKVLYPGSRVVKVEGRWVFSAEDITSGIDRCRNRAQTTFMVSVQHPPHKANGREGQTSSVDASSLPARPPSPSTTALLRRCQPPIKGFSPCSDELGTSNPPTIMYNYTHRVKQIDNATFKGKGGSRLSFGNLPENRVRVYSA